MTIPTPLSHRLQMLTIRDAAEELSLPPSHIMRLIASNLLPHHRLGPNQSHIRILRIDLAPFQRQEGIHESLLKGRNDES